MFEGSSIFCMAGLDVSVLICLGLVFLPSVLTEKATALLPFLELDENYYTISREEANFSTRVQLSPLGTIRLGRSIEEIAIISSNGFVSFGEEKYNHGATPFPLMNSAKIVAPFWDDVDLSSTGQVRYQLISQPQSVLVDEVNVFLRNAHNLSYNASWVLVIQWLDVCPLGNNNCSGIKPNSFQVVITTDGTTSLTIFTYQCNLLNWQSERGAVVGYSISGTLHQQHSFSNLTDLACVNVPCSNFTNLIYQISIGPPLLTAEPMDVIGQTGESVSFLCIARAVPAVNSVLWMKNGNPIGSTNSHTSYEETIGDETRSILLVRSLSESDGGSTYRCRVTNSEGSVESSGGTLTVNQPATITSTLPPSTTQEGSSVSRLCGAFGRPLPDIIWNGPKGVLENSDSNIQIQYLPLEPQGIMNSILTIFSVSYSDNGTYNCTAVNAAHGKEAPLDTDTRTFSITVLTAPVVKSAVDSSNITVLLSDTLIIEFTILRAIPAVSKSGVEWRFTGANGLFNCVSGDCEFSVDHLLLRVLNTTISYQGQYQISVNNGVGSDSETVSVAMKDFVRIQSPPTSEVVNETDSLTLHCIATGLPVPMIIWTKEPPPLDPDNPSSPVLPPGYSVSTSEPLQGDNGVYQVSSVLSVPSVRYSDRGTYTCTASNTGPFDQSLFSNESVSHEVTVQTPPILSPLSETIIGSLHHSVKLSVSITRDEPAVHFSDVVWFFEGIVITSSEQERYNFSDDRLTLGISSLTFKDRGDYRVTASNSAGRDDTLITLEVQAPPNVTAIISNLVVNESSTALLECIVFGHPLPIVMWKRLNEIPLPGNSEIQNDIVNDTDISNQHVRSTLILRNVSSLESGNYTCEGENGVPNLLASPETASIQLTILIPPVIEHSGPRNISITLQRNQPPIETTIGFILQGGTPDSIQWTFQGFDNTSPTIITSNNHYLLIHHLKEISLTIRNVSYSDQGIYILKVSNGAGTFQSSVTISVNVETAVSIVGTRIIQANEHQTVNLTCVADGIPRPRTITWFRNGTLIDPVLFPRLRISESDVIGFRSSLYEGIESVLSIENLNSNFDKGLYTCRSTNGIGLPAVLNEPFELRIIKAPPLNLCSLRTPCSNGGTCVDTEESYYCLCTFDYMGVHCEEVVLVETPPVIINPPQNTTGELYHQIYLSCEVSGSPTPRVTWFKDGKMVTDGDSSIYQFTISELGLEERGFYHCEATSRVNGEMISVVSDIAIVNIRGVVQYIGWLKLPPEINETTSTDQGNIQKLLDEINEFVAGSIIEGDSSLFFIELHSLLNDPSDGLVPIIITIINSEGGSDELLLAVQTGLSGLSFGLQTNISFQVSDRHDGCRSEISNLASSSDDPELDIQITWPEVNIGEVAIVKCPCGGVDLGTGSLEARRYCGGNFTNGAHWEEAFLAPCNFSDLAREICNLAKLPPFERISRLGDITDSKLAATEVSVAASVLLTASDGATGDRNLTENYFGVVDNINGIPTDTLRESVFQANVSARLLESVESLVDNVPVAETDTNVLISKTTFSVSLQRLDPSGLAMDTVLSYHSLMENDTRSSTVVFPQDLLQYLGNQTNYSSPLVSLAIYRTKALFLRRMQNDLRINSDIISASIRKEKVKGLAEPIVITLNADTNSTRQGCYFWDSSLDDGYGGWSQENCESNRTANGQLVCKCNHLTNFAALLDTSPGPVENQLDTVVGRALNAVSYIGVIVSIFCLLATIVTYLGSKKLRVSEHGKMLLNLCFSLLGLYISFILALHGTPVPALCAIFSVMLHYFLLVTFFVMASEAINLYMKLVVVLGKGIQRYFIKATLVSWIVPFLIVLFCFAPSHKFYIGEYFCRVHDVPFYIGILVPFIVIYLFNWGIFIIIMIQLMKKNCRSKFKESYSSNQKMSPKQQFSIALTLSLLFGLGWGIGLLATHTLYPVTAVRDTFAALFILLTGFQGLFIFIMHCVRSREVRREWKRWAYKAVGKDFSTTATNSSVSQFSRRAMKRQSSMATETSYIDRSATLRHNVTKMQNNSFDFGVVYQDQDKTLAAIEKQLEAKEYTFSMPLDDDMSSYPVPAGISHMVTSDLWTSNSSHSLATIDSGCCRNCDNPMYNNELGSYQTTYGSGQLQHSSSDTISRPDSIYCTNVPNPLLDSEGSGVFHDEDI